MKTNIKQQFSKEQSIRYHPLKKKENKTNEKQKTNKEHVRPGHADVVNFRLLYWYHILKSLLPLPTSHAPPPQEERTGKKRRSKNSII